VEDALAAAIRQKVANTRNAKRAIRHQSLVAEATNVTRNGTECNNGWTGDDIEYYLELEEEEKEKS